MNIDDVKNILNTLQNDSNQKVIKALIEKIDSLPKEEILSLINELGTEEKIKQFLADKIEKMNKPQKPITYYSNAEKDNRESRTCSQVLTAIKKVLTLLEDKGLTIYISGGTVPYLLLNQDSNRLHDDVDTVCRLEDIDKIRELFRNTGDYVSKWDSKTDPNSKDYGFELKIDGEVPFGIYPFEYKNGTIIQYSFDPYTGERKTKTIPIKELSDYICTYRGKDGKTYNTMSLEYIKLTKDRANRKKDIIDSKKIEEIGIRPEVMARLVMYNEVIVGKKDKQERNDR